MGPIVMVFGAAMFVLGMSLCLINRTISKDDVQSFDSGLTTKENFLFVKKRISDPPVGKDVCIFFKHFPATSM